MKRSLSKKNNCGLYERIWKSEGKPVGWALRQHHLYWPGLDVDVAVESIRHPEKFPLISKELRRTKRTNRHAEVRR